MAIIKYTPEQLQGLFLSFVDKDVRFQGYDISVERAKYAHCVMSGELEKDMVVKYKCSETERQQEQRFRVNMPRTKFVLNKAKAPLEELMRCDNVTDSIKYEGEETSDPAPADMEARLKGKLSTFEGVGLTRHIFDTFSRLNCYDANAFYLIETKEAPSGESFQHAVEVFAHQVVSFEHDFGELQYFAYVAPHFYPGSTKEHKKFLCYGHNVVFEAIKTPEKSKGIITLDNDERYNKITLPVSKRTYYFRVYQSDLNIVPAMCVGYKKDDSKKAMWLTKVPFWWDAKEIIDSLIQSRSEECLARALHGIIQKFAMVGACKHSEEVAGKMWTCKNGSMTCNGIYEKRECPSCKGSGLDIHTSTQDVIHVEMPEGRDELIPLSDMIYYAEYPKTAIDDIKEARKEDEADVMRAIYCSNYFDKGEVQTQTATEIRDKKTGVNNTLGRFGSHISAAVKYFTKVIAAYNNQLSGLEVSHAFPADMKIEGVGELLMQRQTAVSAGAPQFIIETIDWDILSKKHKDNPMHLARLKAQERWRPFRSKSEQARTALFSELDENNPLKTLYCFFDMIFSEVWEQQPQFGQLPTRAEQWAVLLPIIRQFQQLDMPEDSGDIDASINQNQDGEV